MTKYDDLKEFADSTEREIKNCPVDSATHTIAMSHKGWRDLIAAIRSLQEGVMVLRDAAEKLQVHLTGMLVASCNCDTKTPDVDWHKVWCRYRQTSEAVEMIGAMLAAAPPAQPNRDRAFRLLQQQHDRSVQEVFRLSEKLRKYEKGSPMLLNEAQPQDEPVAWVIPGDDNANANGFLDAMAYQHGEFTRPLYDRPTLKQHTALELLGNAAVDYARAREGK
jgi:hypothetical protein